MNDNRKTVFLFFKAIVVSLNSLIIVSFNSFPLMCEILSLSVYNGYLYSFRNLVVSFNNDLVFFRKSFQDH